MANGPRRDIGRRLALVGLAAAAAAVLGLVIHLAGRDTGAAAGESDAGESDARLVYLVLLLVMVCAGVVTRWRTRPGLLLRHLAVWAAIGFVLVAGYGFRFEMLGLWHRVAGELVGESGIGTGDGEISFRIAGDGHFRIRAEIDGAAVRLLFDTGATVVVLSPIDAQRIGFELSRLAFTTRFHSANGTGMGAPVWLREIRIGPIVQRDVRALINRAPMASSLLGMSFLKRLGSYRVSNGTLVLRR